jgi:hypothetical protein
MKIGPEKWGTRLRNRKDDLSIMRIKAISTVGKLRI